MSLLNIDKNIHNNYFVETWRAASLQNGSRWVLWGGSASAASQPCGMVLTDWCKNKMGGGTRNEVYSRSRCRRPLSLTHDVRAPFRKTDGRRSKRNLPPDPNPAGAMGAGTKRRRLPYGRGRERATGGSRFPAFTAVASAKRSKADSATAPPGAGPP